MRGAWNKKSLHFEAFRERHPMAELQTLTTDSSVAVSPPRTHIASRTSRWRPLALNLHNFKESQF